MPVNLSRVVLSPRLTNKTPIKITRITGSFIRGKWTPGAPVVINAKGIEAGVSDEEVLKLPEGDRIQGLKKFFVTVELKGSTTESTPDIIENSQGDKFQVKTVDNRKINGFYSAVCVRIKGA